MTRTSNDGVHWDSNGLAAHHHGGSTAGDAVRPKGRIRRSMTACNTCRKLKTRCDLDPRSHACRRCLSLRIDCELPETPERFQDNALAWSDATGPIPFLEERLNSLERGMGDMTRMMRQMLDRSPNVSGSVASHSSRGSDLDEASLGDAALAPKPVHLMRKLQAELFGETGQTTSCVGDFVSKGIIDSKLSLKLIRLFVENFGSWVSIDSPSDFQNELGQSDPLLFNTACLLAARYVPGIPAPVLHAMYVQVRLAAATLLWTTPPLPYETLQALTLLCLWSATVQKEPPMDSWLLSGISINHAIVSFDFLNRAPTEYVVTDIMLQKLRLWNALCLTQLHFAIGNARPFNLQPKYLDHCSRILEHPSARFEDGKVVAEIQLYLITLKLQNNAQRMRFDSEYDELEQWKSDWTHLFAGEQSSALELSFWFCQLLLHRTAMRLRTDPEKLLPDIVESARLIISRFLQIRSHAVLQMVDHAFFIVGYAALTLCDFSVLDPLIEQIQAFLLHLAPSEDHIAYRFSCIIGELKRRYTEGTESVTTIKASPFEDDRRMSVNPPQFMPAVMETIPEGYEALEQIFAGFIPTQPLSDGLFSGLPGSSDLPGP
ncbi:hypothetical protein ASPZODRAFT_829210 [Penicilliopsis zonata CBS 506.65]|uniref:Transcriptional activator of proteases prtT n=1 Tax=Penicilliopsis zonata CBS 506.65 TaxID=1073090 RepID=A0A1L9SAD4_9EURO|nr:hypothetical protein ASPZODRAFT_829210 [Penicilliopsis zonata CBS 506.65]OJJ44096.1 hypothetical protein ASPZODRAFT_829210 [Penicilliopsis zonata CBS 506.65]